MVFGEDFFMFLTFWNYFYLKIKKLDFDGMKEVFIDYLTINVMVKYFDDDINMKIKYQFSKKNFPFFRWFIGKSWS